MLPTPRPRPAAATSTRSPPLREELLEYKHGIRDVNPTAPVFATPSGRARAGSPAGRPHAPQAAAPLRVAPRRARARPRLCDGAARPHRPGAHTTSVHARDAPAGRREGASAGA